MLPKLFHVTNCLELLIMYDRRHSKLVLCSGLAKTKKFWETVAISAQMLQFQINIFFVSFCLHWWPFPTLWVKEENCRSLFRFFRSFLGTSWLVHTGIQYTQYKNSSVVHGDATLLLNSESFWVQVAVFDLLKHNVLCFCVVDLYKLNIVCFGFYCP